MKEKIQSAKLIILWLSKDRSKKTKKSMTNKENLGSLRSQKGRDGPLKR